MECNDGREDLNKTFYDWIENLENLCDKSKSSSEPSSDGEWQTLDRITPIISMMGSDIIARAKSKGWSEHDLRRHLERLLRRLKDFDWIIRSGFSSDILNDKYLWWHLNITELYKTTSIEQRRSFTNKLPDMRRYIAAYLSEPTLHYPYLDWLLLDAITACGLVVLPLRLEQVGLR